MAISCVNFYLEINYSDNMLNKVAVYECTILNSTKAPNINKKGKRELKITKIVQFDLCCQLQKLNK